MKRRQVNKNSSSSSSQHRSSSTSRTVSSTCSTMQQVSTALEQIQVRRLPMREILRRDEEKDGEDNEASSQVQESQARVTVALPRSRSRAQSLPRYNSLEAQAAST